MQRDLIDIGRAEQRTPTEAHVSKHPWRAGVEVAVLLVGKVQGVHRIDSRRGDRVFVDGQPFYWATGNAVATANKTLCIRFATDADRAIAKVKSDIKTERCMAASARHAEREDLREQKYHEEVATRASRSAWRAAAEAQAHEVRVVALLGHLAELEAAT